LRNRRKTNSDLSRLASFKGFASFFRRPFPNRLGQAKGSLELGGERAAKKMGLDTSGVGVYPLGEDASEAKLVSLEFSQFRRSLIRVWVASSTREREWRVNGLQRSAAVMSLNPYAIARHDYRFQFDSLFLKVPTSILYVAADPRWLGDDVLPPFNPLQQALYYLSRNAGKLLICRNHKCPSRLFFRNEPNQGFCSTECGAPSRNKSKRNWWRKKGTEWRRKKKNKTKPAKRRSVGKV
jgi:hypothetical protein